MTSNLVLIGEVVLGLLGLLSASAVRRNAGATAAAATGAASGLALIHGIYELSRRVGETRFSQALSLFTASATFLFCVDFFLPPAAAFFSEHRALLWTTPFLASIAWATSWKWIQVGFWILLGTLWIREVSSESRKLDDLPHLIFGRQIYVVNNCSSSLTIGLGLSNPFNFPTEIYHLSISPRTGKYLDFSGQHLRTYYDTVYHNGDKIIIGTSTRIGPLVWRAERDSDGDLQLAFSC